jgi:hypothetical protein
LQFVTRSPVLESHKVNGDWNYQVQPMTNPEQADITQIVTHVRKEASDDYVGVWVVHRLLVEIGNSSTELITQVVDRVLDDDRIEIGDFCDGVFHAWAGDKKAKLRRVRQDLVTLGHAPDIGDVAWLIQTRL